MPARNTGLGEITVTPLDYKSTTPKSTSVFPTLSLFSATLGAYGTNTSGRHSTTKLGHHRTATLGSHSSVNTDSQMYFTLLNFVSTTSGYHLLTPARSYATPTVKSIISTTIKIRHDVNLSNKPSTPTPFLKTKQPAFTTVAGGEKRLLFQNLIFIFRQILNLYFSSFRKTLQSSRANIKIYNITIVSFPLFPPLPSAGQTSKSLVLDLLRRNISYFQYLRF